MKEKLIKNRNSFSEIVLFSPFQWLHPSMFHFLTRNCLLQPPIHHKQNSLCPFSRFLSFYLYVCLFVLALFLPLLSNCLSLCSLEFFQSKCLFISRSFIPLFSLNNKHYFIPFLVSLFVRSLFVFSRQRAESILMPYQRQL